MNIFVTSKCPINSAIALDNRRLIKMILESAQMLSTAIWINFNEEKTCNYPNNNYSLRDLKESIQHKIYKPTHTKHPCTIWTSNNLENWMWLFNHFIALGNEYSYRYDNKKHKSLDMQNNLINLAKLLIPKQDLTPFVNATRSARYNLDFTNIINTKIAYQLYLLNKWNAEGFNKAKWNKRGIPNWFYELNKA